MNFNVIIPARYQSTRLPGKPLIDLAGKPMIQHVYEQAAKSDAAEVFVATDDERISEAVKAFGGQVVMTRADHESGTDRLQEVVRKLSLRESAIVVNVQGDEPLIAPAAINQVAENLAQNADASVATLCESLTDREHIINPHIVTVVTDQRGIALYFSRAPIPWNRDDKPLSEIPYMRHIGLYAYRVGLLNQFVTWPVGTLEAAEKLEQLRVLENNHRIHVAQTQEPFEGGVDTAADAQRVIKKLQGEV